MNKRSWKVVSVSFAGLLLLIAGCGDHGASPASEADFVNPHQAKAEVHNVLCETMLETLVQNAPNIVSIQDLDQVLETGYNNATRANGLTAGYRSAVGKAAEVITLHVQPEIAGGILGRHDGVPDELETRLRALYTGYEIELFRSVCVKMKKRLSADDYSAEVAKAERLLLHHPSQSSDAMMQVFALARASYRFWCEKGPEYVKRLRKAAHSQAALAKVDTSDDLTADGAALIDLETMAVCAAGGATAIIAVEASGAASAIQFVYDNRETLWGALTNDYVWRMWFNGFIFW